MPLPASPVPGNSSAARHLHQRVPVVGGVDLRRLARVRGGDRVEVERVARPAGHRLGVAEAVAAHPDGVAGVGQVRQHVAPGVVGHHDLAELGVEVVGLGDHPDPRPRSRSGRAPRPRCRRRRAAPVPSPPPRAHSAVTAAITSAAMNAGVPPIPRISRVCIVSSPVGRSSVRNPVPAPRSAVRSLVQTCSTSGVSMPAAGLGRPRVGLGRVRVQETGSQGWRQSKAVQRKPTKYNEHMASRRPQDATSRDPKGRRKNRFRFCYMGSMV